MNTILTTHLYENDPWLSQQTPDPPRYNPLGLFPWNTLTTKETEMAWETPPTTTNKTIAIEPPSTVFFSDYWEDDVSVLNDNPDEDDIQVLPQATYNVLASLLDEIFQDDNQADDGAGAA